MNFIIRLSAISDEQFQRDVQRLIKLESSQIREILLFTPTMAMMPAMAGNLAESGVESEIPGFEEQLNSFLSTKENFKSKIKLNQKIHSLINESKDLNEINLSNDLFQNDIKTSDLLIFNIDELSRYPQAINQLFKVLESRPCSVMFLNSGSVDLKRLILKYSGKDPSIYSIYAFSKIFPEIAIEAEDSILISPFTFRKPQLVLEKRFVKKIGSYYGALGFIKLPFIDVEDYLYYAKKVKADLLVLSKSDLGGIKNLIKEHKHKMNLGEKGISIFVG